MLDHRKFNDINQYAKNLSDTNCYFVSEEGMCLEAFSMVPTGRYILKKTIDESFIDICKTLDKKLINGKDLFAFYKPMKVVDYSRIIEHDNKFIYGDTYFNIGSDKYYDRYNKYRHILHEISPEQLLFSKNITEYLDGLDKKHQHILEIGNVKIKLLFDMIKGYKSTKTLQSEVIINICKNENFDKNNVNYDNIYLMEIVCNTEDYVIKSIHTILNF